MNRHVSKALSVVRAYQTITKTLPSKNAVLMILAVGQFETQCGDAWGNSGNWGAIQRRGMTDIEKAIVKSGGKPSPRDPFEILKGDSSPITGKYQIWFWQFPSGVTYPVAQLAGDDAGAWKLINTLFSERPGKPSVRAMIDSATEATLAATMYARGYYEGFHDPRTPTGKQDNIDAYAAGLVRAIAPFKVDLEGWEPGQEPPADLSASMTVQEVQDILNMWGTHPRIAEDGVMGPVTKAAIMTFQKAEGLTVDGLLGPQTWRALRTFSERTTILPSG